MSQVLYIKANPKPNSLSKTFNISEIFVEEYKKNNPKDSIVIIDLYNEEVKPLDEDGLTTIFSKKDEKSRSNPILHYAYEFAEADKYIFASPLWNLGIPSILKAYFDYISVSGITFKYTESGSVGLLSNKKAITIMSRGGMYSSTSQNKIEHAENYIRSMLNFMGVSNYSAILADGVDMIGQDKEQIINIAIENAISTAKTF